jgi:type II secretory ATPase GspE/PulE/Tfp pilus assembly ATPase PilB-like protein
MGVDASLLAPALRAVIGQRLVRKLCTKCRKPATLSDELRKRVEGILAAIPAASNEHPDMSKATFFSPGSCDACRQTGYSGRMGIYEILTVNPQVESRIRQGSVSDLDMQTIAAEQGMLTMEQDGLLKAMEGITDVEEVFRVAAT